LIGALRPVTNQTLAETCYSSIKTAILELGLAPRAPVDEAQVAERLGVSKTPVREALARLTGEGFITAVGRKSFVTDLSLELIAEIYQVRIMLESSSILEIAPHLSDTAHTDLSQLVADSMQALEAEDLAGLLDTATRFHRALIAESRNKFLIEFTRTLFDHSQRVTSAIFRAEQQSARHTLLGKGLTTHQSILNALADLDGEKAATLIRQDIQESLDALATNEMQQAFAKLVYR
jgi:DNA-binding GntR family transcriptional regulator